MTEAATTTPASTSNLQVARETIESLAVAFILALLFKAFIAEAFVIPTGSMAPTLMGAHKDIRCEECGYQYQCGASEEFDEVGARSDLMVIGTTCPLCRKPQIADRNTDSNHATFSGDRILVSKLAYVFSQPRRWDVIVFKFIENARLNYIKRCIGRPNETIRIREGNIFIQKNAVAKDKTAEAITKPTTKFEIARKPPHVMNAMLQVLSDTKYVPKSLVKAGVPSSWQPFPANESQWKVEQSETKWSASVANVPPGTTHWLRYYHRVVDPLAWHSISENGTLPVPMSAQSSRLITDFTAYNAHYLTYKNRIDIKNYRETVTDVMRDADRSGLQGSRRLENDGIHWTGELAGDFEVSTSRNTQAISLMLVEAGIEHVCRIDLASGKATAQVLKDGVAMEAFRIDGANLANQATAATKVRAGGKHRLRFANVDDTLVLWVDGKPVAWNPSGDLITEGYLPVNQRKPKTSASNPLDSAPIAIGIEGGGGEIVRAQVLRDIYYIAQGNRNAGLFDYADIHGAIRQSSSRENDERYAREVHNMSLEALTRVMSPDAIRRNALLAQPERWADSAMGCNRLTVDFTMEKDWYFPMGDNSSASSDARFWGHTPERLMIGRAVMVFWPHYWNAPVRFLPNVQRMGLIR
jgi:signal peptidase I